MPEQESFEVFVRAGLARLGVEVDDVDLHIMRVAERVYGPHRDALLAADLSKVRPENDLDPGSPPRDPGLRPP